MGFLNQTVAQLRDLFASMTPAARITAGMLLAVIGVSLGYLFQGYQGGANEYLFGGEFLQRGEADRVEAAIAAEGLTGYERDGTRFKVPRGLRDKYLAAVASGGALPASFDSVMDESLDLGPFVSGDERKQRTKAAREKQLSMIVSMMSGVEQAHVLFDVREPRGFGKERVTATVSVQPAAGESLDGRRMRLIRGAVAGAIAGLNPTDVTVINLADGSSYDTAGGAGAEDFDEPYFRTRVQYEQRMQQNIQQLLAEIPGVRIQVSAELDDTLKSVERSAKPAGDPATIRETTQTESTLSTQFEDRGRPGLAAQGPNRAQPEEAVAKNENKVENQSGETENFIPVSETHTDRAGLVPLHVSAAIAVPSEYIVRVWKERNADAQTPPSTTDLDNIEKQIKDQITSIVTALFPKETGENPYPNVQVSVFQSLTPEPVEPPSMMANGMLWMSRNSGALVMAGLALVSLLMLRSMVKSIPPAETNILLSPRVAPGTEAAEVRAGGERTAAAKGTSVVGGAAPGATRSEKSRPRLKLKKGASLKDDLTELVREDPDSAAAILKSWIGAAS